MKSWRNVFCMSTPNGVLPSLRTPPRALKAGGAAFGVGLLSILIYGFSVPDRSNAIAVCVALAAASFVAAGLLGFLFGVPRSSTSESPNATELGYLPNTNLEQVSDWLTKLLLGATLTQIGNLTDWFGDLFSGLGSALGGKAGPEFSGVLTVYFASAGFLAGWLATRLYLAGLMQSADERMRELLQAADDAEASGDSKLAAEIRATAAASGLAAAYESLRSIEKPSWTRTQKLEELVRRGMEEARSAGNSLTAKIVADQFNIGTEGARITALAYMEGRNELIDVHVLSQAIEKPSSAFEQYHALVVAREWVDGANPPDQVSRGVLETAVESALASEHLSDDRGSDRLRLATEIQELFARG